MVAVMKQWDGRSGNYREDWIQLIDNGDAELIWTKLYHIVSKHSAIRSLQVSRDLSGVNLKETYSDLTQDLYLKLQEKDRWRFYVEEGYTHEKIEHELYDIEIPNLVSRLLRKRFPESYRIARRISNLLMTKKEFRCFSRPRQLASAPCQFNKAISSTKMVLQVYGLAEWPANKPLKQSQDMVELIKEVAFRMRDTRRAGRGSSSQIVISNAELTGLLVEIFRTIDSPADVRTMRSLAQSKLAIDDSQIISMDEPIETPNAQPEPIKISIIDDKPTPEEVIIEKECAERMNSLADTILDQCLEEVRNKPQRFRKLIEVAWHCYFNQASLSQTTVAKQLNISDSLVSHYRKIFDRVIRSYDIALDECLYLNNALDKRLTELIGKFRLPDNRLKKSKLGQNIRPCST
ncbi:MAG: hypothetical protein AB1757_10860 [Acidobacteriota bacterium]